LIAPGERCRSTFEESAGAFLALALLVWSWGLLPGERLLYETIHGWATPALVAIFRVINYLGKWQFLVPATLLLLWLGPAEVRRRWWLWAGVMILAPILEVVGKEIVGRPRPRGHRFGFPSGHVTAAATYFSLVAYLLSQRLKERAILLWTAAGVTVALVGVARIVLRAHWPADCLGGAVLGLAVASAAYWWHERHVQSSEARVRRETGLEWEMQVPVEVHNRGETR
jgi:undecaprenyl-diphosphatase